MVSRSQLWVATRRRQTTGQCTAEDKVRQDTYTSLEINLSLVKTKRKQLTIPPKHHCKRHSSVSPNSSFHTLPSLFKEFHADADAVRNTSQI